MNTFIKSIIALLLIFVITGCSSDDDKGTTETVKTFEELTQTDIEALESTMSDAILNASNDTGVLWENGKVLLYKTNLGRFGKMKVLNIDPSDNYKLTIEVVTYATDGMIYSSDTFFEVPGTFVVDMDEIVLTSDPDNSDFWWNRAGGDLTRMETRNDFVFVEYNLN